MISEHTRKLLILSKIKGVGRKTLNDLSQDDYFFNLSYLEWGFAIPKVGINGVDDEAINIAINAAENDISEAEKNGDFILSARDFLYPNLLRDIKDRPAILYVRGDPRNFSERAVAIIGTREPSVHGIITTQRVTEYFAKNGWQVVSGLALGVDTEAHKTTIDNKCSTIAVLAQGLDKVYPKENRELSQRILDNNGLLVTEYPYKSASFRSNFVERDRIQAALARGVVMVQSDETGGSWHASRSALNYGRYLLIPVATQKDIFTDYPKSRGNRIMMEGNIFDKTKILNCSSSDLDRLFIIRSKEDYSEIEKLLLNTNYQKKNNGERLSSGDLLT